MSRISQHSQQTQRLPANVLPGIEDPNQVTMSGQPGQQRLGSSASGATDRVSLFKQPSFLTSPGFIPPGAPQTSNPSCEYSFEFTYVVGNESRMNRTRPGRISLES